MKKRKTNKAVSEIKPTKVIQKFSALECEQALSLCKVFLNPNQTALFQKPRRNFLSSDKIWFQKSPIRVNKLGDMTKEISLTASLSKVYTNHCV